jgi:Periplasmic component of the Tol biopolymer transport system
MNKLSIKKRIYIVALVIALLAAFTLSPSLGVSASENNGDILAQIVSGGGSAESKLKALYNRSSFLGLGLEQDCNDAEVSVYDVLSNNGEAVKKLAEHKGTEVSGSVDGTLRDYGATISGMTQAQFDSINEKLGTNQFIVCRNKVYNPSHYAYTEGETDPGNESWFRQGSELIKLTIVSPTQTTEETIFTTTSGALRDPDVSADGTTLLFSYRATGGNSGDGSKEDFHLYTIDLTVPVNEMLGTRKQLTFGSGVADIEPKWLPNGGIIFNSTRDVQIVDCWNTAVSNLYICDNDGKNIKRVGYDQVHTTYPTVTSDGRVLYTRWDYNDRNQMYIQALFQMQQDGTNQTEVYGNNNNFPQTLLHSREIPGSANKYISIATGHHVPQSGRLVVVDTNEGRNSKSSITYPTKEWAEDDKPDSYDNGPKYVGGVQYRYPLALSENEFLVSRSTGYGGDRPTTSFSINYVDTTNPASIKYIPIIGSRDISGNTGAAQIVPLVQRDLFNRPSMVNYADNTATVYMGNVYEGEALVGYLNPQTLVSGNQTGVRYRKRTKSEGVPAANWYTTGYSAGSWSTGTAPFGGDSDCGTSWTGNETYMFTRTTINVSADVYNNRNQYDWSMYVRYDENPIIYLNGVKIFDLVGSQAPDGNLGLYGSTKVDITDAIISNLQSGTNVIAAQAFNNEGGLRLEYEITYGQKAPIPAGTAKYLRVVELKFRTGEADGDDVHLDSMWGGSDQHNPVGTGYAAWDTKHILGIVPIEADGSALFKVPADSSLYYQVLDENGDLIQTMRSWTTLMPGETFSCVGCHEDKNTVPPASAHTSIAARKRVQDIQRDIWMTPEDQFDPYGGKVKGFSYNEQIQPILDANCISCHDDVVEAKNKIGAPLTSGNTSYTVRETLINRNNQPYKKRIQSSGTGPSGWTGETFNDSAWESYTGEHGAYGNPTTYMFVRGKFDVSQSTFDNRANLDLLLNIKYDESPRVYINGTLVWGFNSNDGTYFDSGYQSRLLAPTDALYRSDWRNVIHAGTNTLAVYVVNTMGGSCLGMELQTVDRYIPPTVTAKPFALTGDLIGNNRQKTEYDLSYLVLTNSKLESPNQYRGYFDGAYTNWVDAMSQCEMLSPYERGSSKSGLFTTILGDANHTSVNLTDEELQTMKAWVNVGVPFRGDYTERNEWSSGGAGYIAQKLNKRGFYDRADDATKARIGGTAALQALGYNTEDEIALSYGGKTVRGKGLVELTTTAKLSSGSRVEVDLGKHNFVWVQLHPLLNPTLVYTRTGKYLFTVPSNDHRNAMAPQFFDNSAVNMQAWLPTEEELNEPRNLAQNQYDVASSNGYPRVTGTNTYGGTEFAARNAIDGFTNNKGHGTFPQQSWGTNANSGGDLTIDFGRYVDISSAAYFVRADFTPYTGSDHDTVFGASTYKIYLDGVIVKQGPFTPARTADAQEIDFGATVRADKITFSFTAGTGSSWAGISEMQVFGIETGEFNGMKGDADLNNQVNMMDVMKALEYVTGRSVYTNTHKQNTDVNLNNAVDAADALIILKYHLKLITTWPS